MGEAAERLWSPEEYLAWERAQPTKHEYVDGVIVAMAGASREHNTIVVNIVSELRGALRKKPCQPFASDMRVRIPAKRNYRYPDVSVACDPVFEEDNLDTLLNPVVLIEVLSESTEREDRGSKFRDYRSIPSFREYVLVAQDAISVEHWVRSESGLWTTRVDLGAGERISLASCGVELAVDEFYLKVFPAG